jgi:hypothetical protein
MIMKYLSHFCTDSGFYTYLLTDWEGDSPKTLPRQRGLPGEQLKVAVQPTRDPAGLRSRPWPLRAAQPVRLMYVLMVI